MTVIKNFAVYQDMNCYITKFVPTNGQRVLVRRVGEARGPYGVNKIVCGFSDKTAVAMPKLRELSSLKPGNLYCLKAMGVQTKGKYTVFGFEVAELNIEQYKKMLDIVEYVDIIDGIFNFGNFPKNVKTMEEDPLPSSSSFVPSESSEEPTEEEYVSFKELHLFFKAIGYHVQYYSLEHICKIIGYEREFRISETKAGYRKSDIRAITDKIMGE